MPALERVAVIVMENKELDDVIGNDDAPFFNRLAEDYGSARAMYGITHPSLPNYLALLGGDTFGIDSDCSECAIDAPNLVDQLEEAAISWRAYMEGMPSPCYEGDFDSYVKRHNPFLYFDSIADQPDRCRNVVPLTELTKDLSTGDVPRFVWITPDLCSDTHDCGLAEGDAFLEAVVPSLVDALGEKGVLFITYDEGTSEEGCCETAAGGRVPFVVAGGAARRGFSSSKPHTLYSILRSVEEALGLEKLGLAACTCTSSLGEFMELDR